MQFCVDGPDFSSFFYETYIFSFLKSLEPSKENLIIYFYKVLTRNKKKFMIQHNGVIILPVKSFGDNPLLNQVWNRSCHWGQYKNMVTVG